jgi:hypothetical protein
MPVLGQGPAATNSWTPVLRRSSGPLIAGMLLAAAIIAMPALASDAVYHAADRKRCSLPNLRFFFWSAG